MNIDSKPAANNMIVIDGVDGAGKGVQSRLLLKSLEAAGLPAILTREPGGSPSAEEIRSLLVRGDPEKWDSMTELLLMYASRRTHLRDTIWPALKQKKWVISDRFADSSRAFQGFAGDLGIELVDKIHQIVVGDFSPGLVLILDIPESVALQRALQRGDGEDRFEKKGSDYQARVRQAFRQLALENSETYCLIDADQSIDQVNLQILESVNRRYGLSLCPAVENG